MEEVDSGSDRTGRGEGPAGAVVGLQGDTWCAE